jgi:hypothetical protein
MLVWNESVQAYERWWSAGSKWVYGWFGGWRAGNSAPLTAGTDLIATMTEQEDWQLQNVEGFQFTPPGTQVTLPVTGAYMIDAGGTITVGTTAGNLRCSVLRIRSGATFNVGYTDVAALANSTNNVNRQVLFPFQAGDKISMSFRSSVAGCSLYGAALRISHVGTP